MMEPAARTPRDSAASRADISNRHCGSNGFRRNLRRCDMRKSAGAAGAPPDSRLAPGGIVRLPDACRPKACGHDS